MTANVNATVTVELTEREPFAAFLFRVCRAEAWFRQLTPDEAAALPATAVAAILLLQAAVRDIAGYLPTDTTETRTT